MGRLCAQEKQRAEAQAQRLCGAFRWRLGSGRGRSRRRDCVSRAVEALLGQLRASWAAVWRKCERGGAVRSSDESSCTSCGRAAVADQRTAPSWTTRLHRHQSSCRLSAAETVDRRESCDNAVLLVISTIRPSGASHLQPAQATTARIDPSRANTAGKDIPEHSTTRLRDSKHVLARSDAPL